MSFLGEIKRRKVFQVAVVYIVVAWVIIQVIDVVAEPLNLPGWLDTVVIVLLLVGFPVALILVWALELTPHGLAVTKPVEESISATQDTEPTGTVLANSIVVLPFENLSPDPDNAYFVDGLTEELIADLSKVESLSVISRTSAMSLRGTQKDVGTIARELNVRYVLEGSVRRADNALRITAQLIDADADSHLWAEKYSGTVDDIFDLQEHLSRQIVSGLKVNLTPDEDRQLAARPIPDIRAYEHYLRARGNIYSFDGRSVDRAIRDLNLALDILGDNVLLLRGLGMAHWQRKNVGLSDVTALEKVEEYARRIEALDPDDAGLYLLRGAARWLKADCPGAVIELREAYRRDHADPDTLLYLGVASLSTGQMDVAGKVLHELHRIDPLAPVSVLLIGFHHFFAGRFDEAAEYQEQSLRLGPEVMMSFSVAVRTFICAGKRHRAEECASYLRAHYPDSPFAESAYLLLEGLNKKTEDMPQPSESLRALASQDSEVSQYVSDAYAFGGDGKKALEWLEIALHAGFMNHNYLRLHDPFIAEFRDTPEWKSLLDKIREQHAEFDASLSPL